MAKGLATHSENKAPLRIGVVNYLNAYPLWGAMENHSRGIDPPPATENRSKVTLVPGIPSFLATELIADRLDAACISSIEYWRHKDIFTYHPRLCVSALKETQSIRVFVAHKDRPFAEKMRAAKTIYTDIASRSSVQQLRVVLHALGVTTPLTEITDVDHRISRLSADEALLVIGDVALRHIAEPSYDLQQEYYRIFQRGFVYALWVYRSEQVSELEPLFTEAYARYKESTPTYLEKAAERFGFSLDFTRIYLTEAIRHEMTKERQEDMEFFFARVDSSRAHSSPL